MDDAAALLERVVAVVTGAGPFLMARAAVPHMIERGGAGVAWEGHGAQAARPD